MPTRSPSSGRSRAGGRCEVSNLLAEIGLRLLKAGAAAVLGLLLYVALTGLVGAAGSPELALLCWLAGAAFILLVETSPI